MTDPERKQNNNTKIQDQLNPGFGSRISLQIADLEAEGERPRIATAWRSPVLQLVAFNSGHSKVKFGFHNAVTPSGAPDSLAVDMLSEDYPEPSDHQHEWPQSFRDYLFALARTAQKYGMETGIEWGCSQADRLKIRAAIADPAKQYIGEIGWDPTHVEPGPPWTIAAVKAGKRYWT
jgi:hypothetical protein